MPDTRALLLRIYQILLKEYGYCHKWFGEAPDEIIIGAFLVQNTNWQNVEIALDNLRRSSLLSLVAISGMSPGDLIPYIRPAGFYRQKAPRLISIAETLNNEPLPDCPSELRRFLLSLKGLGYETTDCLMLYVYGHPYFVIDAYTLRIFSRLGLCSPHEKYHPLQNWFHENLPLDIQLFREFHALLIKLAKTSCLKTPRCAACPLQQLCEHNLLTLSKV